MDDEADWRGDEIAGFEFPMENVPLNEPTGKELPCDHLVPKLGDSPSEVPQECQVLPRASAMWAVTLCQISASGE